MHARGARMLRPKRRMAPVLLWLFVIGIVARLTIFLRQRESTEFTAIDANAAAEIVLVGLTIAVLLLGPRLKPLWRMLSRMSGGMLVAYYVFSAATALWSPLPVYSLFRAVETLSQYLAVFVALSYCSDFFSAERRALGISALAMAFGMFATMKLNHFEMSIEGLHTNAYTASAAVLCCYCAGEFGRAVAKRRKVLLVAGLAGLGGVIMGTSSASMIAMLCGLLPAFTLSRKHGLLLSGLIVSMFALVYALEGDTIDGMLFPGKTEEQIRTLHGRTQLWEAYAEDIKAHPILGTGFGVGSRLSSFRYTTNAHNAIFAVLLGSGMVGMVIVLIGVKRLGKEVLAAVRDHRPGAAGCAGAFTAAFINSMGLPIIGESWMAPTLVAACIFGLHFLFVSQMGQSHARQQAPEQSAAAEGAGNRMAVRLLRPPRRCRPALGKGAATDGR